MKVKLLKKLRKRVFLQVGMAVESKIGEIVKYRVGPREDIALKNWYNLDFYYDFHQAKNALKYHRLEALEHIVREMKRDRTHRQLKKLNRQYRRL